MDPNTGMLLAPPAVNAQIAQNPGAALAAGAAGVAGIAGLGAAATAVFGDGLLAAGETSFGTMMFSADGFTGAIAENVTLRGSTLIFDNFTIASEEGGSLLGPARQILSFAQGQGATTLQFTGTFTNNALAAQFGVAPGGAFSFTAAATRAGLLGLLGGF
jgi:hypothetical protein